MKKTKIRDEINNKDKWNLELVYPDERAWAEDFQKTEEELEKLGKQKHTFTNTSSDFAHFFLQDEKVCRLLEKLSIYAHCKNDQDKTNSTYQALKGRMDYIYARYNEQTAFVIPTILKMQKETILDYIQKEKYLKEYRHFFDIILERQEHILDENTEKVLSAYEPVFSAASSTASYLTNADLEFNPICDEKGNEVPFDESSYAIYIRSLDRNVRKQAFERLYEGYQKVKNTLTSTYRTVVEKDAITSRIRNYNSSIEMYLKPKHIPVSLYENLITVVHNNLDTLYEYYDLKKEMLKLDEFHLYDGYVTTIPKSSHQYSFEEAEELVLSALSVYGEDYINQLKEAFANRWIDRYPNKGKKSGAYSTGSYDTLPYVLLNYTNTYNDVSTLAHELGHSMHTYYVNKNNPYITANYPIFLAEIASTTNELLLSHFMYQKSTNREEKLSILNEKLDLFKATIFRQTMFAEFEYIAHNYVDSNNVLTADYLSDTYYELNKKYFGERVIVDSDIRYEWLRIPHFYTPFYVYQYATSLAISCYVAKNIIEGTEGFTKKYIEFLSSGGRDYPLDVLKIIDIDLTDTRVFESAMTDFKNTLEEFKKVYEED